VNEQITTLLPATEQSASGDPAPAAGVDYDWAVEQFYETLYKFAFGLSGNESDAADLTQDTYRVLLTKGGQIRDGQKLKRWLFTTLYRKFLGQRRHNTRFPEVQVETAEWEFPAIDSSADERVDANGVVAALQTLDEKFRAPLVLFYLQELSYREIAAVLDIPIGTIMSRLARGKEILRKRLEGDKRGAFIRQHGCVLRCGNANVSVHASVAIPRVRHRQFGGMAACH
jgi:RNA polymerase sigma-70 factor (ECF subfamily)